LQDDWLWLRVSVTTSRQTVSAGLIAHAVARDLFGADLELMVEAAVLTPFVPVLAKAYLTTQPFA